MERKESELNHRELDILEELCFSRSFEELKEQGFEAAELKRSLLKLLDLELVELYYPTRDDEISFDLKKFEEFYSDYYYLATKKGLKYLFG